MGKSPRWDVPRPFYAPLGVCYLAAVLEKAKQKVNILDADILNYGYEEILTEVKRLLPDLIGISTVTIKYPIVVGLVKFLKENYECKIVLGGNHITKIKEKALQDAPADFVIYGEAEITLLELVQTLELKKSFESIKGLIYREDKVIKTNAERPLIKDLDTLPFPARHLLHGFPDIYKNETRYKRLPMVHMVTSRGCYYRCIFCDHDRNVRYFSPKYVANEIEYLQKNYGIREIHFWDEIFMMTPKRAEELCEEFEKRNIDITWSGYGRLNVIAKHPELVPLMKKSGCWMLAVGVESGNNKVLEFLKKDLTKEEAVIGIDLLHKHRIFVRGLFMLGHLIDTEETINETIAFSQSLKLNSVQFSFNIPLPDTEQYALADTYGKFDKEDYTNMSGHADEPPFIPNGLTKEYLIKAQRKGYDEFYNRSSLVFRNISYVTNIDSLIKYSKKFLFFLNRRYKDAKNT